MPRAIAIGQFRIDQGCEDFSVQGVSFELRDHREGSVLNGSSSGSRSNLAVFQDKLAPTQSTLVDHVINGPAQYHARRLCRTAPKCAFQGQVFEIRLDLRRHGNRERQGFKRIGRACHSIKTGL